MHRRIFTALLLLTLILTLSMSAWGEKATGAQVNEAKIDIGGNVVRYPQLTGMTDDKLQQKINDDIVLSGDVTAHILTLSKLNQSSWGLDVSYESYLDDYVFSMVLSASGKLPNQRQGQSNVAMTYDLSTGERVTLEELFSDVPAATERMEEMAQETLGVELSDYLENTALAPLPSDSFMLDGDGLTFYYPTEQFSYLSGYGGACQFYYEEIMEYLKPDGLVAAMGVLPMSRDAVEQRKLIEASVTAGELPRVPVKLGQPMTEIVDRYRLVRTPDAFPGGRYFVMEAPAFRSVLLISDDMQTGYERSELLGVQLRRGGFHGLVIGQAARADWQKALGKPQETIAFTESMAYDYNLPVGESDVYHFGGHELRLHGDENGILRCVQLGK